MIPYFEENFYCYFDETTDKNILDDIESEKIDKKFKEKLYLKFLENYEKKLLGEEKVLFQEKSDSFERYENDYYYFTEKFIGGITSSIGGKPKFIFKVSLKDLKVVSINDNPIEPFNRNKGKVAFILEGKEAKHKLLISQKDKNTIYSYFEKYGNNITFFEEIDFSYSPFKFW